MNPAKLIEAIEKIFLELLGFLLPGLVLLYSFYFFLNLDYQNLFPNLTQTNEFVLASFAYILGYIIYGMALFRDSVVPKFNSLLSGKKLEIILKISTPKEELPKISKSLEFELCQKIVKKLFKDDYGRLIVDEGKINDISPNSLRNILMSYVPDSDKKIYTFMFRAELCNHLNIVTALIFIIALFSFLIDILGFEPLFNTSASFIVIYLLFLAIGFFLHKTRMRFYSIAMRIPFSIFIAEYYKKS